MNPSKTAIIGGGPAGLTLALALHTRGMATEIYELRSASYEHGGAVMLSPNALRVLDQLKVWEHIRPHGYQFERMTFLTDDHNIIGHYYFGSEQQFGYPGFRVRRQKLMEIMRNLIQQRGIPIHYESKFSHVIEEDDRGVKFELANGDVRSASRLIGADGTHSKVREWLEPNVTPVYSGSMGVIGHCDFSKLRQPHPNYPLPASISGKHGAYVLAPQNSQGTEIFEGRQFPVPGRDRQGWDDLLNDKTQLYKLLTQQKEDWSDLVQSAMEATEPRNLNVWPFHTLPQLDTWYSPPGRVIIVGDAAHTIPPTCGQGVNQAFEDASTLSWLLQKGADHDGPSAGAFKIWQDYRQARIEQVLELNQKMGIMRLSNEERERVQVEDIKDFGAIEKMSWLFAPDFEHEMERVFDTSENRKCLEKFNTKFGSWGVMNG